MTVPLVVVFDLDGTLLRLPVDIQAVRRALGQLFQAWVPDFEFRPILPKIPEAAGLAALAGADSVTLERAAWELFRRAEEHAAARAVARPGAVALVARLAAAGVPMGIVTDNGRTCVGAALEAAGFSVRAFRYVISRDDVRRTKPDPEGLVRVVDALGPATSVWYVGDTPRDVEVGIAVRGMGRSVQLAAVHGGYGERRDLNTCGADEVLEETAELLSTEAFLSALVAAERSATSA